MVIERILCPVDFSEISRRALHHATAIARWYGADLHLLHVIVAPFPPMPPQRLATTPALMTEEVQARVADALHTLVADTNLADTRLHQQVLVGPPATVILEQAAALRVDLIVLGTHGRTGVDRFLLGSTTERVLHRAACTVLTIPPAAHEPPSAVQVQYKRILCAVDFSPSSLRALEHAFSLAAPDDSRITLLHVLEMLSEEEVGAVAHYRVAGYVQARRQEALDRLRALVPKELSSLCETLVELGAPGRTILRTANGIGPELIVMGAQGHSALGLMLFGSTTHTVVRGATCPVLTARA